MKPETNFLRTMGLFALTMTGVSSIIGSGWLFSAYYAAQLAGPAAIFCWLIGGLAVTLIALTICELGGLLPKAGGMARYLDFTHGSLAGFLSAWANWLGVVAVVPIEAMASIQYMSSFPWAWAQDLFDPVSKQPCTSHTTSPVPFIAVSKTATQKELAGLHTLADVAPWILKNEEIE